MNKEIKNFIRFGLLGILFLFLADLGFGQLLGYLYNQMTVGERARANYFIKKAEPDIIIFGSSRALYHYHSKVLSDSLNRKVYNAGRSNQTILYSLALLQSKIKSHIPELVILDVSEDELVGSQKKYELLSALLPYYRNDADIRKIYDTVNPKYKYWSWSHSLPYNSSLFSAVYRGITKGTDKDIDGFLNHEGVYKDSLKTVNNCNREIIIDPYLKHSLLEFISVCQSNHIKLFISVSPRYGKYTCSRPEFDSLKQVATSKGVVIHDLSASITKPSLFSDPSHLNDKGALIYSKQISDSLKNLLVKKEVL